MTQEEELKKIKKVYGENFMKMCRTLFPIVLEEEGKLYEILSSTFSDNCRTLYEDITANELESEFKNIIYSKFHRKEEPKITSVDKTPYELLDEAGYNLVECKTEEEIQSFKKYYAENEELCTFNGGRLDRCVVFFAVRKNVDDIKRENFENPKREDEYGTSVMSIQFDKEGMCIPSIKNRYNHRVNNPDATYGNDLNKIIPGLENSFEKLLAERGLELNSSNKDTLELPNYVVAGDGMTYKYNLERNGMYYCPGNLIIKGGEVSKLENPEQQMLIDYFVLDTKNKTVELYDPYIKDSFTDGLQNIEKIEIRKDKETGNKVISLQKREEENPITIEIGNRNQIVGYKNDTITEIGDNFLEWGEELQSLEVPNVTEFGDCCLWSNRKLTSLEAPNVEKIGDAFGACNQKMNEFVAPKLKKVGHSFLEVNQCITHLDLPNLEKAGENFLGSNQALKKLNIPKNKKLENEFKDILAENNPENEKQENKDLVVSNRKRGINNWYSAIRKVYENIKSKFAKTKSNSQNVVRENSRCESYNMQDDEQIHTSLNFSEELKSQTTSDKEYMEANENLEEKNKQKQIEEQNMSIDNL